MINPIIPIGALLAVFGIVTVTGISVITVLVAIYYRYKVLNRRRRHQQSEEMRRERMRQDEETEVVEETDHHEASALRGEAPPDYREAVVSREYKNISVESLNQFNTVAISMDKAIVNESRQTDFIKTAPPPYTVSVCIH